jgi:predicted HicB family RNase H-like nuclease
MPKKQTEWSRAYNQKAYDRISVTVPKGKKEEITAAAARTGESVNGLINRLLQEYTDKNK